MVTIRNEVRKDDNGDLQPWVNLGDLLDWLDDLPNHTSSAAAAGAASEIRQMLHEQFTDALDRVVPTE